MMFFLKHKDEQFDAFKTYKAWAECQTGRKLKTIRTDRGSEFLSKEQKRYLQEHGIEHQTSMPYSPQQNGRAKRFQQTIINKAESMRHAAGLSNGFWKHAVGTAVHVYNVTPISKAEFLTLKEMWSGSKPDISHLCIFRRAAYIHVLKGKRRKLDLVCPRHGLEAVSRRSRATMKPSRADQANLTTGGLGVAEGGWEMAVSGSSRDLRTQKWHSDRLSLSVSFAC